MAKDMVLVEPIKNNFIVLGKATGKYVINNKSACFNIKKLELKLASKPSKINKEYISDVRFGLAVPYKGASFDYLAQTDFYKINSELTRSHPIIRRNFSVCLGYPNRAKNEKYFLSMEIGIKHPKYGRATTYAHNKKGYISLMPDYVLLDGAILEANAGEVDTRVIGKINIKDKISIDMNIVKYNFDSKWPPTAYVGFFKEKNKNDCFQYFIMKRNAKEKFIVSGYRLLKGGKEILIESDSKFKINQKVRVNMEIVNGTILLKVNNRLPIKIKTHLKKVRSYISVSSGVGNFNIIYP